MNRVSSFSPLVSFLAVLCFAVAILSVFRQHTTEQESPQARPTNSARGTGFRLNQLFQEQPVTIRRVVDGDTVIAQGEDDVLRFRIAGIDAPERGQPFGRKATERLGELLSHGDSPLTGTQVDTDRFHRAVVHLTKRGSISHSKPADIGLQLVSEGLAWCITGRDLFAQRCFSLQKNAKREKKGLWSDPHRKAPWEYRKNHSTSSRGDTPHR